MAFQAELDDRRQEVRRGYASNTIVFWPKIAGTGNVAIDSNPTFEIKTPSGTLITSGTASRTTVDSVERVNITIDASATATYTLDENYMAIVTWIDGGATYVTTVRFDCVLEPFHPLISLNDLAGEVADIEEDLSRQAAAMDSDGTLTADQLASIYGVKAWGDVRRRIRAQLASVGRVYPRLILDREGLRHVTVAAALARIYRAEGGGLDSEAREIADDWRTEVDARLASLGEMDYDANEDRIEDAVLGNFGTVQMQRHTTGAARLTGGGVDRLH